jgi:glycerophosphoryl diester phosphodiesterase
MSLVPHTITALERDVADADASGKQIIVGAICTMFIQPANTAILMYDDDAGTNGSTAKATGVNGQVVVYIEPGTYKLNVNGQDAFIYIADEIVPVSGTLESIILTPIYGQLIYSLPPEYSDFSASYVWVDGRKIRGDGASPDYTIDTSNNLVLTESIETNQTLEVSFNTSTPRIDPVIPLGAIGNPHIYSTLYSFVNSLPVLGVFSNNDWVQFTGRTLEADGHQSRYQITNVSPTIRRNYENYIPVDGDGADVGVTLWAVFKEGFKRNFKEQPIEIIAHRSFHYVGVQNTPLNDGIAMKYDIQSLETDIQVTSDGELVRYHDLTVDAKTDGTGAISSLTYAQVRALVLDDVAGTLLSSRVKIARFDEFVKFAKSVGARIYPEIKAYRTTADIQLMIDVIELYEYESMTIMQSFIVDDLVEVRRINKRVGVGWLTVQIFTTQQYIDFDKLQKLKYSDVLFRHDVLVDFPTNVAQIYDAGIGIAAWGLEDNTEIQQTLEVGVYRQMIDQPQLIASVRGLQNVNY